MFKNFFATVFIGLLVWTLAGCGLPGELPKSETSGVSQSSESSFFAGDNSNMVTNAPEAFSLEMIDDDSFNSLSEDDKIYVAKKLYSTFYKGKDINSLKNEISTGKFVSEFRKKLYAENVKQPDQDKIFQDTYTISYGGRAGDRLFEKRWRVFSHIASTLYYTKLSREYFDEWMAYVLEQTILFSPAYEVESVKPFPELVASNHERITKALRDNKPIRTIVYEHMISKENWARFRSPEDNGREMLEIWLYDYNDADVPLAAKALKNWRWVLAREKNEEGEYGDVYKFYNDFNNSENENNESVVIRGKSVTTGLDFYRMVAEDEALMSTVVDRLVALFFPTMSSEEKRNISASLVESNPTTFAEIFDRIIFSKKYLFESNRIKSIEEIFMGLNHILDMEPSGTTFRYLFTDGMDGSNQYAFTYKLGRPDEGVSDTDSVIRLHQYIRSTIFLNRRGGGWDVSRLRDERYKEAETVADLLNIMFLDIVGRKATEDEMDELTSIIEDAGVSDVSNSWNRFAVMLMTFDYFSRLSEIYTYRKVEVGGEK